VKEYGEHPLVQASESRLGQVFLNLLVNAAQALPEGQAQCNEIRVRTAYDPSSGRVLVEIADTGPGIPPEVRRKLFTPFFTTKPPGVGTGLGLVICQRIVTGLGGEITVASEVGKGTAFRVMLPVATEEAVAVRPPPPPASARRRGRVLVVDDDRMLGQAIRRALREHDTVFVSDGKMALERLADDASFDVILCDLMMPVVTGMELHARLSARSPALAARMIFLTGGAFTPRAQAFLAEVPNPRLEKPFELGELRAMVNERVG
jgi:CheY-like chemotaxis protein